MKFCPTCDVRLKKDPNTLVLTCPKCNYTEGGSKTEKQSTSQETESDFLVLEENEGKDVLPTMEIDCENKECETEKLYGGCFKQEVLMNPQHNSLDAQNVNTLGEITHKV